MKEKIKKILRAISTIIAIIWIFGEITDSWIGPDLAVIIGVLVIWGILIFSLKEVRQIQEERIIERSFSFCENCGAKIKEGAIFCPKCGNKIYNKN